MDQDDKENSNKKTVVNFDEQAERIRVLKKKAEKEEERQIAKVPLFNLPAHVKLLALLILVPFILLEVWATFDYTVKGVLYAELGFVPARWTGGLDFIYLTPLTVISYNFLHGGVLHLIMNLVMLIAFATGVEKFIGGKRMLMLFFLSSIAGVAAHMALHPFSEGPLIGASAGLSGLFGALLVLMQQRGMLGSSRSIWPFVILWVVVSVLFGSMGVPDGGTVAWLAHLGGFFAGIGLITLRYFRQ